MLRFEPNHEATDVYQDKELLGEIVCGIFQPLYAWAMELTAAELRQIADKLDELNRAGEGT